MRSSIVGVATLMAFAALGCSEGVIAPGGDEPSAAAGGGGPPSGAPTPGVAVSDLMTNGQVNPLLGDGRDFAGAPDPSLGNGGEYKAEVCDVVISIVSHTSDPGVDPDSVAARYHAPGRRPKLARGECVLEDSVRTITLDGVLLVQLQANWNEAAVDEVGEAAFGKGKVSTSECTYRLNPPVWKESSPMWIERVANGWRVSALPGSVAVCEATGEEVPITFELLFVEDAVAEGWGQ